MATNWNEILSNTNNLNDVLSILKKVLAGLETKADFTTINEALQDIEGLKVDIGAEVENVNTTLDQFQAKADDVIAKGFYTGYATETALKASLPAVSETRARADDTRKIWRWTRTSAEGVTPVTGTWTDTGPSEVDKALEGFIEEAERIGITQQQLQNYYSFLQGQMANLSSNKNWVSSLVVDASGKTQQEINDRAVDLTLLLIPNNSSSVAKALNSAVIRQAIITAKAANKKIKSDLIGTIHIEGDFNFKKVRIIKFYTDIVNATGTVIVGGFANTGEPVDIHFGRITNGTSALLGPIPLIDTFRMEGVKAGTVNVGDTNLIRIHAIGGDLESGSNAYFRMFLDGVVRAFRISDEGTLGWNNEFEVRGGRLIDLDITGTGYVPNDIVFDNNVWEGSLVKIVFKRAWTNRITNARFEGAASAPGITFEPDTMQNTVIQKWSGTGVTRGMFDVGIPWIDLGEGNQVTTQNALEFNQVELLSLNPNTVILANAVDSAYADSRIAKNINTLPKATLTPSLFGIGVPAQRYITTSEMIAVNDGDAVKFDCEYSGKLLRPTVYIYDENMKLITTGSDHVNMISGKFNAASGNYSVDADLAASAMTGFSITSNTVKYIRLSIYAGASGFIKNLTATLYTQKLFRSKAANMADAIPTALQLNGLTTKGFVPRGIQYLNTQDKKIYSCTLALDTTVSAVNGAVLTLINATGVQVGDIVGLALNNSDTAWGIVTAVSGLDVTVSNPSDVAVGARCVINHWQSYDKQAAGLTPTSTAAQIVAALQAAGLVTG